MMKKIFRTLAIVAVAALGLTACENDINEQIKENEGEKVTVEVVASTPGTRSAFGDKVDGAYTSTWTKDQVVYFAPYQPTEGNIAMSEATVAATGAEATFSVDFTQTQEDGAIYAFSPKGAQSGAGGFTSSSIYYSEYMYLNVPAAQTTSATSCDEQVHVLYASKEYTGGFPTSVNMDFNHVLAYGKMTIKGFEGEIASVAITFPEAVVGGSVKYYYLTNTFTGASANTITVTNVDGNKDIWFGIVPTQVGEEKMTGDMTVVITDSESNTYTKELATTGKLAFKQGQVSAFAVNMADVEADGEKDYCGNYNIVAKRSSGNFFYMTSDLGTAGTKRFQIVDTGTSTVEDVAENADYVWVVEKSGDNYTIKTTEDQYITWTSGNSANLDVTGKAMTITANGDAVNIRLVDTPARYLSLNNNSSYNYFAFYEGTQVNDLYLVPFNGTIKKASSLTFNTTEYEVDLNGLAVDYDFHEPTPTLTTDQAYTIGFTLSYSSSNDAVATVDAETGDVEIIGVGTTVITATFAGNANYNGCSASYTINVIDGSQPVEKEYVWSLLTSQLDGKTSVTQDDVTWAYSVNSGIGYTSNGTDGANYVQIGSNKKPLTSMSLTTSDIEGKIKSITVNGANSGASTDTKMSITVGGVSYCSNVAFTSTNLADYAYNGTSSGEIVISFAGTAAGIKLHQITVVYEQ